MYSSTVEAAHLPMNWIIHTAQHMGGIPFGSRTTWTMSRGWGSRGVSVPAPRSPRAGASKFCGVREERARFLLIHERPTEPQLQMSDPAPHRTSGQHVQASLLTAPFPRRSYFDVGNFSARHRPALLPVGANSRERWHRDSKIGCLVGSEKSVERGHVAVRGANDPGFFVGSNRVGLRRWSFLRWPQVPFSVDQLRALPNTL